MKIANGNFKVDKYNLAATKTWDCLGINDPDEQQIAVVEKILKRLAKTERKVYLTIMSQVLCTEKPMDQT